MLKRKAIEDLIYWKEHFSSKSALLIEGARQVGKTYLVREFGRTYYEHFAEVNFLDNKAANRAVNLATDSDEVFARISAFVEGEMVAGSTLVFLDEVQECLELVTAIKFLVDEHPEYDWVLSGSLLGVEMTDVKSVPVGYLHSIRMFPLDFEEYCWAEGPLQTSLEAAREAFADKRPMDPFVNERLLSVYHEYLVVGGMPQAVDAFMATHNIQEVRTIQGQIIARYRQDISKYAKGRQRTIKRIFDLMPSELTQQNRRFIVTDIDGDSHVDRYENDFMWLADAGVALPTYNLHEPKSPLLVSLNSAMFKLFMSDVGLLSCLCGMDVTRDMLAGKRDVTFGALYENAVAQELAAHGFPLYYYKTKSIGEIDFVVETSFGKVLPIEVKSGSTYKRHAALDKLLQVSNFDFDEAIVFCESNFELDGKILYAPVYATAFLQKA